MAEVLRARGEASGARASAGSAGGKGACKGVAQLSAAVLRPSDEPSRAALDGSSMAARWQLDGSSMAAREAIR